MTDVTRPYSRIIDTVANREKGVFTYDVTWLLAVNVDDDAEYMLADQVASTFVTLPNEGDSYPNNPIATCRKVNVKFVERGFYHYSVHYSTENSVQGDPGTSHNPLFDRPRVRWVGSVESRPIYKDRNNEGILNSAGDPIIETIDDNVIGASIEVNVASVPAWILSYRNAVNNAQFTLRGLTIGRNVAKLTFPGDFLSDAKERNGVEYYVLKYDLQFDERDAWKGQPLDAGYREKAFVSDGSGGFIQSSVPILNGDGTELTEPVPLDGLGNKLEPPTPQTVVILDVEKYIEKDFTLLPGLL